MLITELHRTIKIRNEIPTELASLYSVSYFFINNFYKTIYYNTIQNQRESMCHNTKFNLSVKIYGKQMGLLNHREVPIFYSSKIMQIYLHGCTIVKSKSKGVNRNE